MSHSFFALAAAVGFLAAIMVLAKACADEGFFEAWGDVVARGTTQSPTRRFALVAVLIAAVTAALTLHATAVLLVPVLVVAARSARRATGMAAIRIANTGSTLLPSSNITNLLAFAGTGLAFVEFAWLMLPVFAVGVAAEFAVLRWWFRKDFHDDPEPAVAEAPAVPLFPAAVVVAVLIALSSGVDLWLSAAAGAILLGGYALTRAHDDLARPPRCGEPPARRLHPGVGGGRGVAGRNPSRRRHRPARADRSWTRRPPGDGARRHGRREHRSTTCRPPSSCCRRPQPPDP